jgi:hypothetical protein
MCVFSRYRIHKLIEGVEPPIPIPDDLPDGIIIGWRRWCDYLEAPSLKSPVQHTYWTPGKTLKAHTVHSQGLNSGIYAYAKEVSARALFGEVALWGKVWEHTSGGEKGYTAEFAYPLSIFCNSRKSAEAYKKTWGRTGVYVNYFSPHTAGADKKGYVALI